MHPNFARCSSSGGYGTIDNTFNIGTGFNANVNTLNFQPDGKIIVGGGFTSYNGNTRNYIVRLNSNGTIDNTFDIGAGFNSWVRALTLQPNGKIIVGGWFSNYNSTTRNGIARLNNNGSLDNTFHIDIGFNGHTSMPAVETLALQSDEKIIVGGNFTSYNGIIRNRIACLLNCPPASISPGIISNGTIGVAYTPITFTQTGLTGTITWSATGLPAGLSLNSATGVLSGTPTTTGTFNITITATSSNGCSSNQNYTLSIACPTMSFVNITANNAVVGSPYSLNVSITGNTQPVSYTISPALPAGLSLNTSTGQITGTPTTLASAATYTVTATQVGPCSVTQTYTFGVVCPTMSFANSTASNAIIGSIYSFNASVSGNTLPVTYSISPALPTGLVLNTSTGQITGTPTNLSSSTTYIVTATQSGPCTTTRNYTFGVVCPTLTFTNTTASNATIGSVYNLNVSVGGNTQPVTYSVSPALPTGLILNVNTGQISGTPTEAIASTTYTITADQGNGCTAIQNYTFAVESPNALSSFQSAFQLYPNPTRDKFRIESNITNFEYDILDAQGRKLESNKKGNSNEEISLLPYSSGLYMLRIRSSQGTTTLKVSKW
jgi:uncharacterized delta-60 repeat protein